MASITSAMSGDWDLITTWEGGVVPGNADSVTIAAGHSVRFNVDQSGFANGLTSLLINGILHWDPSKDTCLKVQGNITGTGELRVGTEENPIQRPPIGNEYRCRIITNGRINVPTIRMQGWYHEREFTQVAADAAAQENQIVLQDDLDLQPGERIGISYTELDLFSDFIFTVSSYNKQTRTVTLTSNLETERSAGDYVNILSAPINLGRITGFGVIFEKNLDNVILEGVQSNMSICMSVGTNLNDYGDGWRVSHCKFTEYGDSLRSLFNSEITDCNIADADPMISDVVDCVIDNCCAIGSAVAIAPNNNEISNCIETNYWNTSLSYLLRNCVIKGMCEINNLVEVCLKDSSLELFDTGYNKVTDSKIILVDSEVTIHHNVVMPPFIAYNTIFNGEAIKNALEKRHFTRESFDHNQIIGNYKSWCRGGTIETDFKGDGITCLPGRLSLNCTSGDYPVLRDFPVILSSSRWFWWNVNVTKDFSGGTVKMELIDPAEDPLIDPSATPLATSIFPPNVVNTPRRLFISYRSNRNVQAILRISAQNESGTVKMDTRIIEKRIKYGR